LKKFLALTINLPEKIKQELEKTNNNFIKYNGKEAPHKIPHITIYPPRETFDKKDWNERAENKLSKKPSIFKVNRFGSLYGTTKYGLIGELDTKNHVDKPHITLFDTRGRKPNRNFSKFNGTEIPIDKLVMIGKNKGILREVEIRD